jgi:hypothetical protein
MWCLARGCNLYFTGNGLGDGHREAIGKTARWHWKKGLGAIWINIMVFLNNEISNDCRLAWKYIDMLKLSEDVISE